MTFEDGILLFFIGMIVVIIGFFIAYSVAFNIHKKEQKEKSKKETSNALTKLLK